MVDEIRGVLYGTLELFQRHSSVVVKVVELLRPGDELRWWPATSSLLSIESWSVCGTGVNSDFETAPHVTTFKQVIHGKC